MNKFMVIVGLLLSSMVHAEIGFDKFEHVGVSAGLNFAFYYALSRGMGGEVRIRPGVLVMSSMMTGMIGVIKEVTDTSKSSPNLDTGDLAADAIGIAISAATIYAIDIYGKKDKDFSVQFSGNKLVLGWRF